MQSATLDEEDKVYLEGFYLCEDFMDSEELKDIYKKAAESKSPYKYDAKKHALFVQGFIGYAGFD